MPEGRGNGTREAQAIKEGALPDIAKIKKTTTGREKRVAGAGQKRGGYSKRLS